MGTAVKPYNTSNSKKEEVARMFDNISARYDFLNHFLSFGIDRGWRKKVVRRLKKFKPQNLLDVATGTGDLAISAARRIPELQITGIDISAGMLEKGKEKLSRKSLLHRVTFLQGDSENMPFADNSFDALTVAFGVRNFENLEQGLREFIRVIKPGAPVFILEFSRPTGFPVKQLFGFYSRRILPGIGKKISKDPAAYTYLPQSVAAFPEGNAFLQVLEQAGFREVRQKRLSGGIATIYTAVK